MAPGDSRVTRPLVRGASSVATAGSDPVTLNDRGQLAVYCDFTDTTGAVLVYDIPNCAIPADVNLDSVVDGRDVAFFVDCALGTPGTGCPCGDFDEDLQVTPADMGGFSLALLAG